jgi:hypothetical protein
MIRALIGFTGIVAGMCIAFAFDGETVKKHQGFALELNTIDVIMINRALMMLPDEHARDTRHKIYAQVSGQVTTPEQERQMSIMQSAILNQTVP